jgi:hypothetical protein
MPSPVNGTCRVPPRVAFFVNPEPSVMARLAWKVDAQWKGLYSTNTWMSAISGMLIRHPGRTSRHSLHHDNHSTDAP